MQVKFSKDSTVGHHFDPASAQAFLNTKPSYQTSPPHLVLNLSWFEDIVWHTLQVASTPGSIAYIVMEQGPDPNDMDVKKWQNSSISASPMESPLNLPLLLSNVQVNNLIFVPGTPRYQPQE